MRLFYNGIFADMEAGRSIAPDGLYNSVRLAGGTSQSDITTNISALNNASSFFISLYININSASAVDTQINIMMSSFLDDSFRLRFSTDVIDDPLYDYIEFKADSSGGTSFVLRERVLRSNGVPVISYDEWHHIVITGNNGSTMNMIIDGVSVDSTSMNYNLGFIPNINFGALDIIQDLEGKCYLLEINAPTKLYRASQGLGINLYESILKYILTKDTNKL